MDTRVATIFAILCVFLLYRTSPSIQAEKHSLCYIYTGLSKPVDQPGIYKFTAMGLLDDRQIDYYDSEEKRKIPKQHWMREKLPEDYWEKGTQSRRNKEQWINDNIHILMNRMRHNTSDLHVLQWRHGCEIEQQVKETKSIDEYGYDGENFLSFDDKESQWVTPVEAALPTKRKWDNLPILDQHTTKYLNEECVDWLNKFIKYAYDEFRKASPPGVHVFARKSKNETKLKLTCLATGFYPRDVTLTIRKYREPLPENEIKSTGVRPNHDETLQIRKSAEISKDDKAEYDCFSAHRTLKEPIIIKWDGQYQDWPPEIEIVTLTVVIPPVIAGSLLVLVFIVVYIKRKGIIVSPTGQYTGSETSDSRARSSQEHTSQEDEDNNEGLIAVDLLKKMGHNPKDNSRLTANALNDSPY